VLAEVVPEQEQVVYKINIGSMAYRIAIASSDGESVNQHFGRAGNFLIYEISEGHVEFIEDREVTIDPEEKTQPDANFERVTILLKDCKAVFVLKIGERAVRYLYINGIKSFAVDFSLNFLFTTLLKRQNSRIKII
jgi:predicted Fe-Mo cluster-binding NifX family protein